MSLDAIIEITKKCKGLKHRSKEDELLLYEKCLTSYMKALYKYESRNPHIRLAKNEEYTRMVKERDTACLEAVEKEINEYKINNPENPSEWS